MSCLCLLWLLMIAMVVTRSRSLGIRSVSSVARSLSTANAIKKKEAAVSKTNTIIRRPAAFNNDDTVSKRRRRMDGTVAKAAKSNGADGIREVVNSKPQQCGQLLLSLPNDIVIGELINRPSKRNRSPYVADVFLKDENREVLVHVPNLDMGGKCISGSTILMKPARDRKGKLIGKDAINTKYNTPKCEFIAQL